MDLAEADPLAPVREALSRHDWQAAFDAAGAVLVDSPEREAERADMHAEAAWWLGRLDTFIAAREVAFGLWFVGTAQVNPMFHANLDNELGAIRRSLDTLLREPLAVVVTR